MHVQIINLPPHLLLHIIGHKEEQLSPSNRMKTEGSNAELIVELINKLGKTSLP